ncbi:MAG: S-layer family protein [Methylacidiphilales bacterium]|nr:S-layer family protein [Candidatus Methylacidiphilales bacterium]
MNLVFHSSIVLLLDSSVKAQIIPDASLNLENSNVMSSETRDIISGGAIRGSNLFHSFQEFNINPQKAAFFTNPTGIENIISRVTGKNRSEILGTLGILGKANLFLINPNGIIFGKDASLAIQGSFFASTAESIIFDNNFKFSATNPLTPPLLTINIPIGLQMGANPGKIINQSQTPNLFPVPPNFPQISIYQNAGLQVLPGQTLGLIGGDILIDNGNLTANSGQIVIGSVASEGLVRFTANQQGLNFNYNEIQKFGNISIINNSLITTSGIGGGQINIKGGNITLDNSRIDSLTFGNLDGRNIDIQGQNLLVKPGSQISTLTLGEGKGSNINIRANDVIEMIGLGSQRYRQIISNYIITGTINYFTPELMLTSGTSGTGNAGNITIESNDLLFRDGVISTSGSLGIGNGGNMTIRARQMEMVGSTINNGTIRESSGKGGNLNIEVESLTLRDESVLASVTTGTGTAGNIQIKASEFIELLRTPENAVIQTAIATNAFGLNGNAGDITIDTKRLTISEGAGISSSNGILIGNNFFSNAGGRGGNLIVKATESIELTGISGVLATGGNTPSFLSNQAASSNLGGDIYISTPILTVGNGGLISAASFGLGNAGDITIDADKIEVFGTANNGQFVSKIEVSSGLIDGVTNVDATANAGSLNLNVNQLNIRDRAILTVQALGSANAGNINIKAKEINLDNQAKIDAATGAGTGGNINLRTQDIFLRRGSKISTDAGSSEGGNIDINSQFIVAVPKENSDITANGIEGNGGKINITATSVFGLQVNNQLTSKSDISASSRFGVNGTVKINTFNIEPTAINQLPTDLVDTANQINQTCSSQIQNDSFTVTGRGGIPLAPKELFNVTPSWIDWRFYPSDNAVSEEKKISTNIRDRSILNPPLVEANALVLNPQGHVELVANSTTANTLLTINKCFQEVN